MSIVKNLAESTMLSLAQELHLNEIGSAQDPFKILRSPMSPEPVGQARVFRGSNGEQMVYIGLTVPMIALDSHMVFAFTGPDSLVPHFTVDAVHAGDHYAFHLDLIPRVDLAVNLGYMQKVYQPLTETFQGARKIAGLSEAHLSPLQLAVMSPWMLAHRASAEAMDSVGVVCSQYRDHWLQLYRSEWDEMQDVMVQDLSQRDSRHRSVLFSREVDPVWTQVDRLLGQDQCEALRLLLTGPI